MKIKLGIGFFLVLLFGVSRVALIPQVLDDSLSDFFGPYLGEIPPRSMPKVFGKDFISTADISEFSCCFSRDGCEFYFARQVGPQKFTIFWTRESSRGWTTPEPAPFSQDYFNHEPYISQDGSRLYWGSVRPLPNAEEKYSIWFADRISGEWGLPRPLEFDAMYITATSQGILYYTARGRGGACVARAEFRDGGYQHTILEPPVLSDYWDGHPCIAPDESYLIFDSENRPGQEECGLFISFKKPDGAWTDPQNMQSVITKGRFAMFSPDGKYIFFSAPGQGEGKDLFWVASSIVERFRPESLR